MIIGGDDTPAPPASDLWSSDVRFTLTKSVCKTDEFGDSTAGCHGDEVSWEMQVGKQARHTLQFFNEIFSHELRKRRTEW